MIKYILPMLIVVSVVVGCKNTQDLTSPIKFMGFVEEVVRVANNAPCDWVHGAADTQSVMQYDFGCHAGKIDNISLYLDKKENAENEINFVRFLWQERTSEYKINDNDKQIAESFVAFLANSYDVELEKLKIIFAGNKNTSFKHGNLDFIYTYTTNRSYNLHRLKIANSNSTTIQ